MNESKKWYESTTIKAALLSFFAFAAILLMQVLPAIGVNTQEVGQAIQIEQGEIVTQTMNIWEAILTIIGSLMSLLAVYGRIKATSLIVKNPP